MEFPSVDPILVRESGGHPVVLQAILEREIAVDRIVERNEREGVTEVRNDPLWCRYQVAAHKVAYLKEITGIPEPTPVAPDKT